MEATLDQFSVYIPNQEVSLFKALFHKMGWAFSSNAHEEKQHVTKEDAAIEGVPDIVMSLLGAASPIDDDDLNGRKAYSEFLKQKYQ